MMRCCGSYRVMQEVSMRAREMRGPLAGLSKTFGGRPAPDGRTQAEQAAAAGAAGAAGAGAAGAAGAAGTAPPPPGGFRPPPGGAPGYTPDGVHTAPAGTYAAPPPPTGAHAAGPAAAGAAAGAATGAAAGAVPPAGQPQGFMGKFGQTVSNIGNDLSDLTSEFAQTIGLADRPQVGGGQI